MFVPKGDYYDILPPRLQEAQLEVSWAVEPGKETIRGTSAKSAGVRAVVTAASPQALREAVECLAYCFHREVECHIQTPYCSCEADDQHRAYLWTADGDSAGESLVIGACCFRLRQWSDAPDGYALQWIWFHPYERRRGHFRKALPYFTNRFGRIIAEEPYSPAMEAFLKKHRLYPHEQ